MCVRNLQCNNQLNIVELTIQFKTHWLVTISLLLLCRSIFLLHKSDILSSKIYFGISTKNHHHNSRRSWLYHPPQPLLSKILNIWKHDGRQISVSNAHKYVPILRTMKRPFVSCEKKTLFGFDISVHVTIWTYKQATNSSISHLNRCHW